MAVKTKEEILNYVRDRTKDKTDDATLSFVEDITDTLNDYETRTASSDDWKKKYETNDAEWRKKYKERFFTTTDDKTVIEDLEEEKEEPGTKTRYEDLFKTEER